MRRTLAIFQASPRRLLTLLLITFLVVVAAGAPRSGGPTVHRKPNGRSRTEEINNYFYGKCKLLRANTRVSPGYFRRAKQKVKLCTGPPHSKKYELVSEGSKGFVQVMPGFGRHVYANGMKRYNPYNFFNMTSQKCPGSTDSVIRIKGIKRQHSLCFTTGGILIQKEDVFMSVRCAFYQRVVKIPGYESSVVLVSAFNPNFVVAFNNTGKRLRGGKYSGLCNVIQLLEEEDNRNPANPHSPKTHEGDIKPSQDRKTRHRSPNGKSGARTVKRRRRNRCRRRDFKNGKKRRGPCKRGSRKIRHHKRKHWGKRKVRIQNNLDPTSR